jgi:SAM-dependent methyltransferase
MSTQGERMNAWGLARRLSLVIGICLVAASAFAQAQPAAKPFEPQVGQQGKDVVWVPTADALVEKMLDMAKVTSDDFVMDLGSGDGRTVIAAAKRGARALGVEYNPDMVELSKRNAAAAGVTARASFVEGDLFKTDFSQATVITMFLLPSINLELRPKILELRPGTRIVSNTFTMGEWEPDQRDRVTNVQCASWCEALFWIVPARVSGTWKMPQGEITLKQQFQVVSGALGEEPIAEGRLRGDEITFTAGGALYTGRVNGSSITGTVSSGGTSRDWSATRIGG